jgi:hypothetical protein
MATHPSKGVYTLTPVEVHEEEGGDNGVVTGTIFLFGILACTLFDSRATHSFISEAYIKLRHVSIRPLVQNLMVATPGGKKVVCDKIDGDQGTASKDFVQVPIGPVTRARAKKFMDVLNGLIQELWAQPNSWRPNEHDPRGQQIIVTLIQVLEGSGQG